jgi:regulator of protease activity HflC (stomatin/prohibitin superfamily)
MLKFGEIVNADIEPGLHFKMPLVNTVRKFDARILTEDSRASVTSHWSRRRWKSTPMRSGALST